LTDKMWCHNLPVDSWDYDGEKDPLEREKEASMGTTTTTGVVIERKPLTLISSQ